MRLQIHLLAASAKDCRDPNTRILPYWTLVHTIMLLNDDVHTHVFHYTGSRYYAAVLGGTSLAATSV